MTRQASEMRCPYCGHVVTPCINAQEGMQVRAFWCQSCNWTDKAIGRERLMGVDYGK